MSTINDLPTLSARASAGRPPALDDGLEIDVMAMFGIIRASWMKLAAVPLVAGAVAYSATHLVTPTFTATTSFLPPQQSQNAAASALATLGPLAGLAGGAIGVRSSGDLYVGLMQTVHVADNIIQRFQLKEAYDVKLQLDARKTLAKNVQIGLGKKDGIVSVQVDDTNPARAAQIANMFVDELRRLTATLAVTEAQQRRVFFDQQLQQTRDKLGAAQRALQASGFNPDALKAEPKAAADAYARLRSELTRAEVQLQVMRSSLADGSPPVQQQQNAVAALREQLARAEKSSAPADGQDYVGRYREFKYQEALFEMYARQFELARAEESRDSVLIQVLDVAKPPEVKSRPRRGLITGMAAGAAFLLALVFVLFRKRELLSSRTGR